MTLGEDGDDMVKGWLSGLGEDGGPDLTEVRVEVHEEDIHEVLVLDIFTSDGLEVPLWNLDIDGMVHNLKVEVSQSIQEALGYYHTKEPDQYSLGCPEVSHCLIASSNINRESPANIDGGLPANQQLIGGDDCIIEQALTTSWIINMVELKRGVVVEKVGVLRPMTSSRLTACSYTQGRESIT